MELTDGESRTHPSDNRELGIWQPLLPFLGETILNQST